MRSNFANGAANSQGKDTVRVKLSRERLFQSKLISEF